MLPISYIKISANNKPRQFYFLAERKLTKLCKQIKLAKCKNGSEFFQIRTENLYNRCV